MSLGGDPAAIRLLASRVREWEQDVEQVRTTLRSAEGIEWVSAAADTYRTQLNERAADAATAAGRFGDLADELDQLARTLESRQQILANAFATARDAWNDAVEAGEDAVEGAWEYAGDMLSFARDRLGW